MSGMNIGLSDNGRRAGGNPKPLTVTVQTVRDLTGLGATKVWGLIRRGELEVTRIGNRTLVRYDSLERLLDEGTRQPSRAPGGVAAASVARKRKRPLATA